ncbi:3-oxoacyl-[acyl-carrier protein] reductase [Catenuloplanes nepalensis]|uniref:3-oxoacyl-[acyl-carrier protein] reductase n=1 Tax=Catenuloplanes nepalensis TaxID=587533 RepID=A0ABT9N6C8_9ACTN|nr:SDR family oxidoreductase [Catenuloplanes nepalensis]MDP9798991.1 3-oxoacyl-[acyl-carrier protein] reductase [Catenuloplanes nepalensis]
MTEIMAENTRVAIVTGGSRGIGRQAALRLAADGYAVTVVYVGKKTEAEAVVEEIVSGGGRAIAARADVAEETDVAAVFDAAEAAFGGVDVVVNAAGIMVLAPIAEYDLDTLDRVHRVNIRGAFVVSQQAARRVRDGGAIINFSTSVIGLGLPGYAAYAASKGAVEAMTMVIAREMRGRDVTVNVVAPGPTATSFFFEGKDQATIDRMAKQPPLERLGTPEDAAEVVAFLAGPGRWINGQVIRANGGIV